MWLLLLLVLRRSVSIVLSHLSFKIAMFSVLKFRTCSQLRNSFYSDFSHLRYINIPVCICMCIGNRLRLMQLKLLDLQCTQAFVRAHACPHISTNKKLVNMYTVLYPCMHIQLPLCSSFHFPCVLRVFLCSFSFLLKSMFLHLMVITMAMLITNDSTVISVNKMATAIRAQGDEEDMVTC